MLKLERDADVAVVNIGRDVINAINNDMVNDLASLINKLKHDSTVKAIVITSSSTKFFSIGLDIPELYDLPEQKFRVFYRMFNRLCRDILTLNKPTVAAISGHAVGGGCMVALCCDYRYIADGNCKIGLTEVKLGAPVPYLADCVLRTIVGQRNARIIMEGGDLYLPADSLSLGIVDGLYQPDDLLSHAVSKARDIGSLPQKAWLHIKQNRVESVEERYRMFGESKEDAFIEAWYSPDARTLLKESISLFSKVKSGSNE